MLCSRPLSFTLSKFFPASQFSKELIEMNNGYSSLPATSTTTTTVTLKREKYSSSLSASGSGLFSNKSGYKFWVLSAIILLAFWSMFTGSVSLKWSSNNISRFSDDADFHIYDDLDILEVEERKKVVMRMWDVYSHSSVVRLPRFWLEAFEAAYEYMTSDVPGVRDVAISEIAKMSMRFINLDPLPVQSTSTRQMRKKSKMEWERKEVNAVGTNFSL